MYETAKETLMYKISLLDSVGEGEGGEIWENGIETCIISCMKRVASPGSMHDTGCLGLVHWDDPEGGYGEGGGKRVQDGDHRYTCGRFISIFVRSLRISRWGTKPQALEERLKQGRGQTVLLWDQSLTIPPTVPLPPGCCLPIQMQYLFPSPTCIDASCLCTPKQDLLITTSWIVEYWSGLPCLPPGDLPNPGIDTRLLSPWNFPGKSAGVPVA